VYPKDSEFQNSEYDLHQVESILASYLLKGRL
jgi:hypothetical protein